MVKCRAEYTLRNKKQSLKITKMPKTMKNINERAKLELKNSSLPQFCGCKTQLILSPDVSCISLPQAENKNKSELGEKKLREVTCLRELNEMTLVYFPLLFHA